MAELTNGGTAGGGLKHFTRLYSGLVMLPHTVFALPFALTALVLASYETEITLRQVVLIVVAFTGARSAAMGFNRLIDHRIDSQNPRTAGRHLPAGRIDRWRAIVFVAGAAAVFITAAGLLGRLPLLLSPLALAVVFFYSYTKYFTSFSHLVLGLALAIAPVGAYLAVTGAFAAGVIVLAGAVVCWVAGFDIIYSLQDERFDRAKGLFSVPARLGAGRALWISRLLHLVSALLLAAVSLYFPVGLFYWIGWTVASAMLIYEQTLVTPNDISRVNAAFFTVNGAVSILFFLLNLADRLVRL
ncbi:MAG: UbiA-like polyprenyltransferase [Candidatus Glassbacteria bacterium]